MTLLELITKNTLLAGGVAVADVVQGGEKKAAKSFRARGASAKDDMRV